MSTDFMPAMRVEAARPAAARFGLFSVAEGPLTPDDPHWQGGVYWEQSATAASRVLGGADCAPYADGFTKLAGGRAFGTFGADPFTVFDTDECSAIGRTYQEAYDRAMAALLQGEQRAVERTFWTGVTLTGDEIHPHLAEDAAGDTWPAAEVLGGGAVSVKRGFSLLEGAMGGCYGGQAVIHAPQTVAAYLGDGEVARVGGGAAEHLESIAGSRVALGGGYPGTSPAGADPAANTTWIYATGAVRIWRGTAGTLGQSDADTVGRTVNSRDVIVERTYAVGLDGPCLFAVLVNLPAA